MKVSKKVGFVSLIILSLYICVSCANSSKEKVEGDIFNPRKAIEVSQNYLKYIKGGNINDANKLCTEELLSKNTIIGTGTSNVVSYNIDNIIESSNSAYVLYNVIRSSEDNPKCDLDNFAIKVSKESGDYKISEVKAVNKKQVFVKDGSLRMIGENGGSSELIIRLSNMPKDIYPRENKVMLYKEETPNNSFGPIAIGYKGERVAISTLENNKTFIAVAFLEESRAVIGEANKEGTSSNGDNAQNLQEGMEKAIAKKVIPIDILEDINVKNIIFSQEEKEIIVEYNEKSGVNRIKVYKADDGEVVDMGIDNMFPKDQYNIKVNQLDKNSIIINVSAKENLTSVDKSKLGEYKADMEKLQVTKI
ncbi:hypothetical protein JCM1393_11210 [Clostridium carnis]